MKRLGDTVATEPETAGSEQTVWCARRLAQIGIERGTSAFTDDDARDAFQAAKAGSVPGMVAFEFTCPHPEADCKAGFVLEKFSSKSLELRLHGPDGAEAAAEALTQACQQVEQ